MVRFLNVGAAAIIAVSLTAKVANSQSVSDYTNEVFSYGNVSDTLKAFIVSSAMSLSDKRLLFSVLNDGSDVLIGPLKIGSMIEKITSKDQLRVKEGFKDAALYFGEPVLEGAASYLGIKSLYAGPIAAGTVAAIEVGYAAYEAKMSFYEAKIQKNNYINGVADLMEHLLPGGKSLSPNKIASDNNIITQLLSENKAILRAARSADDINAINNKISATYLTRLNNALRSLRVDRDNLIKEERVTVFGYAGFDETATEKEERISYLSAQIKRIEKLIYEINNNKLNIITKYVNAYVRYLYAIDLYNLSGAVNELEKAPTAKIVIYPGIRQSKSEQIKSDYTDARRYAALSTAVTTAIVSPTLVAPETPVVPVTPTTPTTTSVIVNYGGWARDVPTGWATAFAREQWPMESTASGTYTVPGVPNLAIGRTYPDMTITTTSATRGTYQYTDWGDWNNQQVTGQAYPSYGGNWVVGHSAVQFSQLPTSGTATYTGVAAGNNYGAPVAGVVDIQAQFATRTMNSRITFGSTAMNWTGIPMVSGANGVASFNSTNSTGGRFGGNFFGMNGASPAEAAGYFRSGDFGVAGVWRAKQSPTTVFIGEN